MPVLTNSELFQWCSGAAGARALGIEARMGAQTYSDAWDCLSAWIRSQLEDHGQGASIPHFLKITWAGANQGRGGGGGTSRAHPQAIQSGPNSPGSNAGAPKSARSELSARRPNANISEHFVAKYDVKFRRPPELPEARAQDINYAMLSYKYTEGKISKDVLQGAVKRMVARIGEAIQSGGDVDIDFGVMRLYARERQVAFGYDPRHIPEGSGLRSILQGSPFRSANNKTPSSSRPGTAASGMSARSSLSAGRAGGGGDGGGGRGGGGRGGVLKVVLQNAPDGKGDSLLHNMADLREGAGVRPGTAASSVVITSAAGGGKKGRGEGGGGGSRPRTSHTAVKEERPTTSGGGLGGVVGGSKRKIAFIPRTTPRDGGGEWGMRPGTGNSSLGSGRRQGGGGAGESAAGLLRAEPFRGGSMTRLQGPNMANSDGVGQTKASGAANKAKMVPRPRTSSSVRQTRTGGDGDGGGDGGGGGKEMGGIFSLTTTGDAIDGEGDGRGQGGHRSEGGVPHDGGGESRGGEGHMAVALSVEGGGGARADLVGNTIVGGERRGGGGTKALVVASSRTKKLRGIMKGRSAGGAGGAGLVPGGPSEGKSRGRLGVLQEDEEDEDDEYLDEREIAGDEPLLMSS